MYTRDLRKLDEAVRHILLDTQRSQLFAKDPLHYLDRWFGEGTGECYSHSRKNINAQYLDYRSPAYMDFEKARYYRGIDWAKEDRRDAMAYACLTGGTTATTSTATSGNSYWIDNTQFIRNDLDNQIKKTVKKGAANFKWKKRRVKTMPLKVSKSQSLLDVLQAEFDHWAGDQLKVIHG